MSLVHGLPARLVLGTVAAVSASIAAPGALPIAGGARSLSQEPRRDTRDPDRGLSEEIRARLALVDPGQDAFEVERWAALLEVRLARLAESWASDRFDGLGESSGFAPGMLVGPLFDASAPEPAVAGWRVNRRAPDAPVSGAPATLDRALAAWRERFPVGPRLDLEVVEIAGVPPRLEARVRVQASGAAEGFRRQDNAEWSLAIELGEHGEHGERGALVVGLAVLELESVELAQSAPGPFVDVTESRFADPALWRARFAPGLDRWRRVLAANLFPGALGHHGLAVGDVDGDGREDLYLCRPGGLPNQLLLHAASGQWVDGSRDSGVDLLDYSSSALLADFDGDGDLDLVVATGSGLLFFENRGAAEAGKSRFERRVWIERSLATSLAAADIDVDGDVDLYACSYLSPYEKDGLPVPYHAAENGEANQLLLNDGAWNFVDATVECGLDEHNRRFSLAASFEDFDGDGDQDLYVANDFGRNNLYENDGGRFRDVARQLDAEDIAAGMGVTWGDFDRDGWVDLYVTNMHSQAGSRLTSRPEFRGNAAAASMGAYRRHARGNTLMRNLEGKRFEDVTITRGAEFGRWGWGAIFVDFDNDGALDLLAPNGFVSGERRADIDSFFWRQAVLQSPEEPGEAGAGYALGWSASNRLMRQGWSWNGFERNVALWNTGDGRYADASAALGLDHADDTRAAARLDFDGDGDLDLVLTARTGPMLRILENRQELGRGWIELEPRSDDPARTAVGARVVVETSDGRKLVETLRCGEGYLAQSSWRLHFGLGATEVRAVSVRWPGGPVESFGAPARNAAYVLKRGSGKALASVAGKAASGAGEARDPAKDELAPRGARCVLPTPIGLPRLALETVDGKPASVLGITQLGPEGTGEPLVLIAFSAGDAGSLAELVRLTGDAEALRGAGLRQVLALCVDPLPDGRERALAELARIGWPFARGFASEESVQVLELVQAALHDDAHALTLPTAFLISPGGSLTATYEGAIDPARLREDLALFALDGEALRSAATPFPGTWIAAAAPRLEPDIAARLSAHGLERPASEYELVRPEVRGFDAASFQVEIGVARQRQGRVAEAIVHYRRAIAADPGHVLAAQCLAAALHRQGDLKGALVAYQDAIRLEPSHAQTRCNLGYLCLAMNDLEGARAQVKALDALKSPLARTLESYLDRRQ